MVTGEIGTPLNSIPKIDMACRRACTQCTLAS